jgi:hypothetical protein
MDPQTRYNADFQDEESKGNQPMKYQSIPLISVLLSALLLPGCGGGGGGDDGPTTTGGDTYTGSTAQATVDSSNAKELSTGAAAGTQQAVVSDTISGVAMRPQPGPTSKLADLAPRIAQWIDRLDGTTAARTEDLSDICDAGGSAVVVSNDAGTSGSIVFTSCGILDSQDTTVVINGEVTFTANTGADTMSMVFRVTVTYLAESQSINMSLACTNVSTSSVTCSMTSDFTGIDNRVYRIEDMTVSGDRFSGFYVSMRLYDPDYGWVDVTTSMPMLYNCVNGMPGSGMITVNGSGGSFATACFDSCSSYTVTVDGVGTVYSW